MPTYPDTSNTWPNSIDLSGMIAAAMVPMVSSVSDLQGAVTQATVVNTNGAGRVSWVFPTPFSAPPVIGADPLALTNQPFSIRLVSLDATQVTLDVLTAAAVSVSLIGLTVLTALTAAPANVPIHIAATKRGS